MGTVEIQHARNGSGAAAELFSIVKVIDAPECSHDLDTSVTLVPLAGWSRSGHGVMFRLFARAITSGYRLRR